MKKTFLSLLFAFLVGASAWSETETPRALWTITLPSINGAASFEIDGISAFGPAWPDGRGGVALMVSYFDQRNLILGTRLFWINSKKQVRTMDFGQTSSAGIFRVTSSAVYLESDTGGQKVTADAKGNLTAVPFGTNAIFQGTVVNDTLGFFTMTNAVTLPIQITRWTN